MTRVLAAMRFTTSFASGAVGAVRILHMEVLDFSIVEIGTIMACYSLLIVLAEVPSGAVSDVWGRRNTKLLSTWVIAGSYFVFAAAGGLVEIAVAAVLLAVGRALFSGAADAWFVDEVGDPKSPDVLAGLARSEAAHNIGFGLGALTGAIAPQFYSGAVSDDLIFAPVFILAAVLLGVDLLITWRQMVEHRSPTRGRIGGVAATTIAGLRNAIDSPKPRRVSMAMVCVGGAVACTELLTPLGLAEGLGTEQALIIFGPLVAGSWVFSAVASVMTSRFEAAAGSVERAAAILLLVMAVMLVPVAFGDWYYPVAAYIGVNLMLGSLLPLLSTSLHHHVRSANRSAAASTLNLSMMLGAAAASFVIGGFETLAVVLVAVAATAVAASLFVLPTEHRPSD